VVGLSFQGLGCECLGVRFSTLSGLFLKVVGLFLTAVNDSCQQYVNDSCRDVDSCRTYQARAADFGRAGVYKQPARALPHR